VPPTGPVPARGLEAWTPTTDDEMWLLTRLLVEQSSLKPTRAFSVAKTLAAAAQRIPLTQADYERISEFRRLKRKPSPLRVVKTPEGI